MIPNDILHYSWICILFNHHQKLPPVAAWNKYRDPQLDNTALKGMSPSNPFLQGSENYVEEKTEESVIASRDGRHQGNNAF